jgi:tetratricopeptide (TPR) repeat protein
MSTLRAPRYPGLQALRRGLFAAALLAAAGLVQAIEPRFALVIGNTSYANAPLPNAQNDANAVAKVLERAGFKVDLKLNANRTQMTEAISRFGGQLGGDAVGLFYFAGHGLQIRGRNFLVPVGADPRREDEVAARTVDVQQLLDRLGSARNRVNVIILDACRDNPFAPNAKTGAGGLSQLDAPTGSLIAFATAPGAVASDGKGANGLYTQHLLANIERPGTPIEEVFKRVRLGVRLDSNGTQVPWESTSLEADFSFFAAPPGVRNATMATTLPPPPGIEQIVRAESAYEMLRQGQLDGAEAHFKALAASAHPEVVWMGREGLAEVLLRRGNIGGALAAVDDIIAKAPTRSAAYLIRGRALAANGRPQDSAVAIQRAASGQTSADFSWQKSGALVAVGNLQNRQDPAAAIKSYQAATRENPQSVEALSNLAVALNNTGDPQRAAALLERAQKLDPNDTMTAALLRQVRESLAEQDNRERQKYVDDTVKELAARFRAAPKPAANADDWTSPVLALTVLPFQDQTTPALNSRIGLDGLLHQALTRELQARGFTLVERRVLDRLMAEIKLGSSELADPDTQVKLGKLFAARMMVSGSLHTEGIHTTAALRAIDTETSRLAMVRSDRAAEPVDVNKMAATIADAIAKTVKDKYPLKGRVVAQDGERVIINLGKKHGVIAGQGFNVLSRGEPIEHNGRVLGYRDTQVARLTVTEVDELLAYARLAEPARGPIDKNLRIIARAE